MGCVEEEGTEGYARGLGDLRECQFEYFEWDGYGELSMSYPELLVCVLEIHDLGDYKVSGHTIRLLALEGSSRISL